MVGDGSMRLDHTIEPSEDYQNSAEEGELCVHTECSTTTPPHAERSSFMQAPSTLRKPYNDCSSQLQEHPAQWKTARDFVFETAQ
jgi:hypothetical protein